MKDNKNELDIDTVKIAKQRTVDLHYSLFDNKIVQKN